MKNIISLPTLIITIIAFSSGFFIRGFSLVEEKPIQDYQHVDSPLSDDIQTTDIIPSKSGSIVEKGVRSNSAKLVRSINKLIEAENDLLADAKLKINIAQWAEENPLAALEYALQKGELELATLVCQIAGKKLGEAIVNWLEDHKQHPQYSYLLHAYFNGAASHSPEQALDLTDRIADKNQQNSMISVVVDSWAKSDMEAALEWVESQNPSASQREWYDTVLLQYIEQNPKQAAEYLSSKSIGLQNKLMPVLAEKMIQQGVYSALDWAETLPEELKDTAMGTVMDAWVHNDIPDAALDYLLDHPEMTSAPHILNATVASIASQDPSLLTSRLNDFPDQVKLQVIEHAAMSLVNKNMDDFDSWVEELPEGSQRDQAAIAGIDASLRNNPAKALLQSESLSDQYLRINYIEKTLTEWASFDSAMALDALHSIDDLSLEQKEIIEIKLQKFN